MRLAPTLWICSVVALFGCTGAIDDGGPASPSPTGGGPRPGDAGVLPGADARDGGNVIATDSGTTPHAALPKIAPARVRRLTGKEVEATIRDLIFAGKLPLNVSPMPAEELSGGGFDNDYDRLTVPFDFAQSLSALVEDAGTHLAANLGTLFPCDVVAQKEEGCAKEFVAKWGLRIFRRPPTTAQTTELMALFRVVRAKGDYPQAIAALAEAMLQSPYFLFRTELGGTPDGSGVATLTPFELASALSYFIWRSAPDEALLTAAATGKLDSPAGLSTEARRLLSDPRAKTGMRQFFFQWLELGDGESNRKSDPDFTGAAWRSMMEEIRWFFDDIMWARDAQMTTLYTSTITWLDRQLATIYGVPEPVRHGWGKATVSPTQRAGFLTMPAFIASHTGGLEMNPVGLGTAVRRRLLCQTLPDPPPDVPPPPSDPNLSVRERFRMHSDSASCKGCHALIDPIGHGFEQFDVMGRYRTQDHTGAALTAQGGLVGTDVDGAFTGAPALAARLASSRVAAECLAAQMLEYALGRSLARDSRRLEIDRAAIGAAVDSAGTDLKKLVQALVTTDAFRKRDTRALPMRGAR